MNYEKIILDIVTPLVDNKEAVLVRKMPTEKEDDMLYLVVADSRSPRDGRFIEIVGTYNPNTNPATVKINEEVALKWLNNGAQPTDTVRTLLKSEGIMNKFHELKNKKGE